MKEAACKGGLFAFTSAGTKCSEERTCFAPLGATRGTAPNGAEVRREPKFYKHSAPTGAKKFATN